MFGYLSSAYNWSYALLQLPSGLLLDRFGVRRVGIVSTVIWSIASFAAAISGGVGALFASRLLLGSARRQLFLPTRKLLATGSEKRAQFGNRNVRLHGKIFLGHRHTYIGPGAPPLRVALEFCRHRRDQRPFPRAVLRLLSQPERRQLLSGAEREYILRGGAQPEDRARAAKGAPLAYLLRQRQVWGLVLGFASYNYSFYLLLTWLPSYLSTTHHIDLLHSAFTPVFPG